MLPVDLLSVKRRDRFWCNKTIVAVHNFLITSQENYFDVIETEDVGNKSGLVSLVQVASNNYSKTAKQVRDNYKVYFNSGARAISCQNNIITRTD